MKIEVLFSEVCNFYGDPQNVEYLKQSCPAAEFIYTDFNSEPYFVNNIPDIIIMGSMSEDRQRKVIEKMRPYKARLGELCENGIIMLFTGNASDVFCREIEYVTEKIKVTGLGIFDIDIKTDWFKRVNGKIIGFSDENVVVGFRSQFAEYSGDNSKFPFLKVERGFGFKPEHMYEGMRRNNLICTQILGPILPLNPEFTADLLRQVGVTELPPLFDEFHEAYVQRVHEFRDPDIKF